MCASGVYCTGLLTVGICVYRTVRDGQSLCTSHRKTDSCMPIRSANTEVE
jgi:hypothetical protein